MALQVVSILSSSKGALEVDDKDTATSQKSTDHKGAEASGNSSSGSKFGSSKSQLSHFNKKSATNKPTSGPMSAEGTGRGATGEVTPLNKYFKTFVVELLRMFDTDRSLLESKGSFVIR